MNGGFQSTHHGLDFRGAITSNPSPVDLGNSANADRLAPAASPRATDGQEMDDGSIKFPYSARRSRGNEKGVVENARE